MTGKRKGVSPKAGTSREAAANRRKVFVAAYIANGGNATDAAIKAGFTERSARTRGNELVKDRDIQAQIADMAKETAKRYELTADLVVRSIVQELSFDPANLYRDNKSLKDITELDEDTRMALASVEFEQIGGADSPVSVRKVKWASRHQAREQAMRHLGLFEKDNRQKGSALASILAEIDGSDTGLPAAG